MRSRSAGVAVLGMAMALGAGSIPAGPAEASKSLTHLATGRVATDRPARERSSADGPVTVIVQLDGAPVAAADAAAGGSFSTGRRAVYRHTLQQAQQPVAASIRALGGTVLAGYQSAYNGLKVRIPRHQLDRLAAVPDVTAVHAVRAVRMNGHTGLPIIQAPDTWGTGLTGVHGEGTTIGLVDSGLDYTHADFGGPGTTEAYRTAHATETAPADPTLFGPLARKVKGGIDLAGDTYDPDPDSPDYQPVPHPDPNPLDCNGHGTHVAGTAAGYGVLADGRPYRGLYGTFTLANNTWLIAPGVAPKADLYPIRIFGCHGTSDLLLDAIDWAVQHHIDILNLSLSSPFGTSDSPEAVAVDNAVKDGTVVVAASGEDDAWWSPSDRYYVPNPAAADLALSAVAMDSNARTAEGYPNNDYRQVTGFSSAGPRIDDSSLKPDVTAPGVDITSAASGTGNQASSMTGTSMATAFTSGLAALVEQAHPTWDAVDLRAAVVNTSSASALPVRVPIDRTLPTVPLVGGNGLLQASDAVRTQVTATSDRGTTGLSFGYHELLQDYSGYRLITLHNHGDQAVTFTTSARALSREAQHVLAVSPGAVQVPAHGSATVTAHLTIGATSSWIGEDISGAVVLKPAAGENGGVALKVPYQAMIDAASDIVTTIDTDELVRTGSTTGVVTNRESTEPYPALDAYTWGLKDADEPADRLNDVRAVGVTRWPDISYGAAPREVRFLLDFYEFLPVLSVNEYDVYLDLDRDGTDDYLLAAVDAGVSRGRPQGYLTSMLYNLHTGAPGVEEGLVSGSERDTLMIMGVDLTALDDPALTSASPRLNYHVTVRSLIDGSTDSTGTGTYNAWTPALSTSEPHAPRRGSYPLRASYDAAEFALTPALGLLMASGTNVLTREAQLIPVDPAQP